MLYEFQMLAIKYTNNLSVESVYQREDFSKVDQDTEYPVAYCCLFEF